MVIVAMIVMRVTVLVALMITVLLVIILTIVMVTTYGFLSPGHNSGTLEISGNL